MTRKINKLTDIQLRLWVKAGKPVAVSDGGGLTFTLASSGHASWVFRYRFGGRQRELTLGSYPTLSLQSAREKASIARADVFSNKDVATVKQIEKRKLREIVTFRELALDYQEKSMAHLAPSTAKQRNQHIKQHILPSLGSTNCADVTPHQVAALIKRVGKARTANVAEVTLTGVSEIFKHGQRIGAVVANPCASLKANAITGAPEPTRPRLSLTEAELRELLPSLHTIGQQNALAVMILLSTCCRIGELAKAEWKDVDLAAGVWTIPAGNAKNAKPLAIPLHDAVIDWFRELETLAMGSSFVMPARQSRREKTHGKPMHYEQRALNSMLKKLTKNLKGVRDFTPHDLRSTARSHLASLGVDVVVAERCLNHSLGGLMEIYNQHDYFSERRAALNTWTSFLLACQSEQAWTAPSNISHLRLAA